jgi:acetoin utilization deacetylase AcuC-like enzyme
LRLTAEGLAERDRRVLAALRERGVPVAVSMAGGYGHEIATTVAVHLRTVREALTSARAWQTAGHTFAA